MRMRDENAEYLEVQQFLLSKRTKNKCRLNSQRQTGTTRLSRIKKERAGLLLFLSKATPLKSPKDVFQWEVPTDICHGTPVIEAPTLDVFVDINVPQNQTLGLMFELPPSMTNLGKTTMDFV